MTNPPTETSERVLVPYVCPVCAAQNGVHLISLSRAGGVDCAACGKWLRSADIVRAIHSPRSGEPTKPGRGSPGPSPQSRARVATRGGTRPAEPVARKDAIVWPPTKESRAAVKPLYRRPSP